MLSLHLLLLEPRSTGGSFVYTSILENLGLTDSEDAPSAPRAPFCNPVPMFVQRILWFKLVRFPIYEKTEIWGCYGDPRIAFTSKPPGWGMGQNLVCRARGLGALLQG